MTRQTLNLELFAYLDSVSGVSYERALRAYKAVAVLRLRLNKDQPWIRQVVCNTLRGKVHYHDLFGHGAIDYPAVLSAIIASDLRAIALLNFIIMHHYG